MKLFLSSLMIGTSFVPLSYSYYDPICDSKCENCVILIEDDPFAQYCSKCEDGYFLADSNGVNGCLSCQDSSIVSGSLSHSADDICVFCQDVTGCQQCETGYNRLYNSVTQLYWCQCSNANCHYDTITFDDIDDEQFLEFGFVGSVPDGYYGLDWYYNLDAFSIGVLDSFADPSGNGAELFNNNRNTYGYRFLVNAYTSTPIGFGTNGGIQFRIIQFDIATLYGIYLDVTCNGLSNDVNQFEIVKTIGSEEISTFTIDNGITIDEFVCNLEGGSTVMLVDNIVVDFSAGSVNCDDNCNICQNDNDPPNSFCGQCNNGYFLANTNGLDGCLSCNDEYGDTCMFCADGQGCQQCQQNYARVQDTHTGLYRCE